MSVNKEIMNTRLLKHSVDDYVIEDLVGIPSLCDWFIDKTSILYVNKTADEVPKNICVYNREGYIALPYFIDTILPKLTNTFNLILCGEDFTFPTGKGDARRNYFGHMQDKINALFDHPLLNKMFVENLDTPHPKCVAIPLGLLKLHTSKERLCGSNAHDILYNDLVNYRPIDLSSREKLVLACNRLSFTETEPAQWNDRMVVHNFCKNEWSPFVSHYPYTLAEWKLKEYYLNSKFCLCVRGGGLDPCPKIWQALLCGTIPIIEHSSLDEIYERFPVVFVDKWLHDCISVDKLNKWLEELRPFYEDEDKRRKVLEMLTIDYWWNIINC